MLKAIKRWEAQYLSRSAFWIVSGAVAVTANLWAVDANNRLEADKIEALRKRNVLLEEVTRAERLAVEAEGRLSNAQDVLQGASGWRWQPVAARVREAAGAMPSK